MENISFNLCFCQKDKIETWRNILKILEKKLHIKFDLNLSKDIQSHLDILKSLSKGIWVTPFPSGVYEALKTGFEVIARVITHHPNRYLLLGKSYEKDLEKILKEKQIVKVGIYDHPGFIWVLLEIVKNKINLFNLLPIKFSSFEEMKKNLEEDRLDFILISEKELLSQPHLKELTTYFRREVIHYLVGKVDPETFQKFTKNLPLGVENIYIIPFSEEERVFLYILADCISTFWEFWNAYQIKESLVRSPHIGVFIYQKDRYSYANRTLLEKLKYEEANFYDLGILDLVYDQEKRKEIENKVKRRLSGDFFEATYDQIALKTSDGKKRYFEVYTSTLVYEGNFAGIGLAIDVHEKIKYNKFLNLLRKVNQVLIESFSEEEIFERILPTVVECLDLKAAWIGIVDHEKEVLIPKFIYPKIEIDEGEIPKEILDLKENFYSYSKAYKTNKICIISDSYSYPYKVNFVKEFLKKHNIRSICSIPFIREGKVYAIMVLYSEEPDFFVEEYFEILEELQRDINFALKKIEMIFRMQLLEEFLKQTDEIVMICNEEGALEYVNYSGIKMLDLEDPYQIKDVFSFLGIPRVDLEKIRLGQNYIKRITSVKVNKELKFLELVYGILERNKVVIIGKDLTKEISLQLEREKIFYQDQLTGLPNFEGFSKRLSELLTVYRKGMIFVSIDLYNFSYINKFYGEDIGDLCLVEVGKRLSEKFRDSLIGRMRGDSFGMVLPEKTEEKVLQVVENLKEIFKKPFVFSKADKPIFLDFNASLVFYPRDGKTFQELWQTSAIFLNEAKKKGPNVIEISNPDIKKNLEKLFETENLIKKAFKEKLFVFYYQPIFQVEPLRVIGLEALVRIKENEKLVYPKEFIDYIEKTAYLKEFENFLLSKNIENIERFNLPISINVSLKYLEDLEMFEFWKPFLDKLQKLPHPLWIEFTERIFVQNLDEEKFKNYLNRLRFLNLRIGIDDFGTGYSFLNYIKILPVDFIKIDRTFIKDISKDKRVYLIVENMINLAKKLDIKVIGEGIEKEEEYLILKNLGCDYVQGFFFCKPLSEDEIERFLKEYKL